MMMTIDALLIHQAATATSSRLITTLSSVTGPLHVLPNSDDDNISKDQQQPSKSTSTTHTSSSSRREYGQNNRRNDTDTPSFNNNLGRANSMSSILHQFLEGASSNKNNNKKKNIIELPSIDDLLSSVQLPKNNMMNDMLSSIISKLNNNINIIPTIPNKHDDNKDDKKKKYENVNDFDTDLARDIEDALNLANKLTNDRGLGDMSILSPSTKTTTTSSHHISRGGEDEKNSVSDTNSVQQKEKRTRTTMFQEVNAAAAQGVNKNNHNKVRVETKKKERMTTPRPSTMFEQTNLASAAAIQSEQPKQTTNKFNKPNSNTSAADNIIMMESYMNVADVKQHTVSMGKQQQQRQWQQKQMDDASVNFFSTDAPRRRSSQDYVNDANVKKYTPLRDIVNKEAQVVDKRREQRVNDNTSLMDNMGRGGGMFFATNSARVGRRTETWDSAARDDNVYSSTTEHH